MSAGQRLRGIDAAFLAIESPAMPMHIGALALLDPATAPGGWSLEALRAHAASRLHLAPVFRQRVVEIPFGLHHPIWLDDPDFDLDYHLHRLPVDPPGGEAELLEAVAAAVAVPLDRSRPLWALHVAEGLAGGGAAVLAMSHHAANDGVAGTELLVRLLDLQPEPWPADPEPEPWAPPPLPVEAELIADALSALAARPAEAVAAVRGTVELFTRFRQHAAGDGTPGGRAATAPFSAPRTSLNVALGGPARRVALASLPLAEVRAVKAHFGTTVNDVVLAVCAGALRSWMAGRGEEPAGDLVALVPASVRVEADAGTAGNKVSPMLVSLFTRIDDAAERLAAIAASAGAAKAQERRVGSAVLSDWAEIAPPVLMAGAATLASALRLAEVVPPVYNVSISNVPGPPLPLYLAGARVRAAYPLGPIVDGGVLNITVVSYDGTLHFGLVADRSAVPDLETLAAGLVDSFTELAKAAGG